MFVCLNQLDYAQTTRLNFMKPDEDVEPWQGKSPLNVGADP